MSTPASKRLRYSLAAIAAVMATYVVITAGMQSITRRVERSGEIYPYKQEDWLRYLLPSLWRHGDRSLLLLTGPSTVREDLLVEWFAPAFPDFRVYQGGLSQGTLGDVMAALEYVERVYGAGSVPHVMVLGLSPRFLAEVPRTGRPFGLGLDLYSPYYRVPGGNPVGFGLQRKSLIDGTIARARFMVRKQRARYLTVSFWFVGQIVGPKLSNRLLATRLMHSGWAGLLLPGRVTHIGIHRFALELASPYKYRNLPRDAYGGGKLDAYLDDPTSMWSDVWKWDLVHDAPAVRARISNLIDYATTHGIELYVVNLPESSANRVRYHAGLAPAYLSLVQSAFDTVPLVNLRCLLDDGSFNDAEHARLPGARRISVQTIGFMRDVRAARAAGKLDRARLAGIARRWEATDCSQLARNHE